MIKLEKINKTYYLDDQPVVALDDVSLHVAKGEIFGIVGKSGAGKSTLLRCVNLLEQPTTGNVIVNQHNLVTLDSKNLRVQRHKIGMIFQHFNLLASRTVFGNIALPLEMLGVKAADIKRRADELLAVVELTDRRDYYPDQLSGGQKQRVAIARALASEPHVLLCDEATSSLDPESTQSILKLIKQINRDLAITVLLITHELDVIKSICDKVAVISQGRLVEQGTVLDVFTNPQSKAAQSLLAQTTHFDISEIKDLVKELPDDHQRIVKLKFVGKETEEPILTNLIRNYAVSVNILQADLSHIQGVSVGYTICQLQGDTAVLDEALLYLRSLSVQVEELHHAK